MPTKGGRTGLRFATDLFATSPIKTKAVQVIPANMICKGACEVFCKHRDVIANELVKERPDVSNNLVRESLTDISTANDFLGGGECDCKCKPI